MKHKLTDLLASSIIKYRKLIMTASTLILLISAVLFVFLSYSNKINSDMLVYLPDGSNTSKGLTFLQEHFNIKGDAMFVIEGDDNDSELKAAAKQFEKTDGVTQMVWVGSLDAFSLIENAFPDLINTNSLRQFLKQPSDIKNPNNGKYNYIFLFLTDFSPSTQEAFNVIDTIIEKIPAGHKYAVDGLTATARVVMTETLAEMPLYIIFGILAVALVLLLTTSSFVEPLILLMTLGISVVVNMGTNILFPSISIISYAACSVLQMGIAMDYAIFYMHVYKNKRKDFDAKTATKKTIPEVMSTIMASALTTIGGFLALFFMSFKIGADIGAVIVKGVSLALLTIVFLQPCIVLLFDKLITKTEHKTIMPTIKRTSNFVVNNRRLICAFAAVLIIPAFLTQSNIDYSYFKLYEEPEATAQQELALKLRNQLIIAVPLHPKAGHTHQEFIDDIKSNDRVISVMAAFEAMNMPPEMLEKNILNTPLNSGYISTLFKKTVINGKSEWFTLYSIAIDGDSEDDEAIQIYNNIKASMTKCFSASYDMGLLTGVNDMSLVTPRDFARVTVASLILIVLILMFMLKSLRKSIMLVCLIELGIWLNISINVLTGSSLNFMIYILISSVQLGCTVDYAILLSTNYEKLKRTGLSAVDSAKKSLSDSFSAILTSASIIITTCLVVYFISKNLIVKEMTWLLARGSLISLFLVTVVLPGLLVFFKRFKPMNEEINDIKKSIRKIESKLHHQKNKKS